MGKFKYKADSAPPRPHQTKNQARRPRGLHDFELLSPAAKRCQPSDEWVGGRLGGDGCTDGLGMGVTRHLPKQF